jgi:hypothetical protein
MIQDIWDPGRYDCLSWEVAKVKLSLEEIYHDFWFDLITFYGPFRDRTLNQQSAHLTSQGWVGLYRST